MSGVTGLEDISYSKKDIKESRSGSLNTTKTLILKHQASAGETGIDTLGLVTPTEAASYGFVQPTGGELAQLNLLVNKKNIKIHSSRGVWLQMYEDFLIDGVNSIRFIGTLLDSGGALEGEVFTIYATPVQPTSVLVTDYKKSYQEYLLPDGQATLNLGREYSVGANPNSQIGTIRVFRNGVGPLLRNVGNAAASPLADGNYHEVDSGNGIGTTIEFNSAPSGQDDVVVVEFGIEAASDLSIYGDMQSLYGAFKQLIADAAPAFGWPESRYLTFNPSDIERRVFGDTVLAMKLIMDALVGENLSTYRQYNLTVTDTNWTTVRAVGVPYQTLDGTWRLKFNINGTYSVGTTLANLTIAGVSFGPAVQTYSTYLTDAVRDCLTNIARTNAGGNILTMRGIDYTVANTIASITGVRAAGDVELAGKPAWVP